MKTVKVNGDIISNDYKWIYDWLEYESCCPKDISDAAATLEDGEPLHLIINSPGGDVMAGQEIYSVLKSLKGHEIEVDVQSMAASAASMIAMAGDKVRMSPVATLMIHNCSTCTSGDYRDMLHSGEVLQIINTAIRQAYKEKTGKSDDELKQMMDHETWFSANQCIEHHFADEIIKDESPRIITNAIFGQLSVTPEMIEKVKAEKAEADAKIEAEAKAKEAALEQRKADLLASIKRCRIAA